MIPQLPQLSIKALFENSANYGDSIALSFVDETPLTYGQVAAHVKTLSQALAARGIKKGDRVALLSENGPRWGITYFAVTTMGATIVPILPDFHKNEVYHILRNSGAKILAISSKLSHKALGVNLKSLESVISLDDIDFELEKYVVERFSDVIEGNAKRKIKKDMDISKVTIEENDVAEILYTSGTTGHSKGVMLTHKNIVSNALSAVERVSILPTDRLLSILPLAHSYECTCGFISPFLMGSKIYYIKGLPTAQTLLPAVAKIKPTIILSVPLIMEKIFKKKVLSQIKAKPISKALYNTSLFKKMVHRIAGQKLYKAFGGELRFMIFGGAATSIEVEEFLTDGGFPYSTGYGQTEASPLLTVNPIGQVRHGSCGKEVPNVSVKIIDADPKTGIGEIVAKGPNVMPGYYNNEDATKSVFTDDGWLITGDKGYLDKDGYLYIKGRSKNLIVGPSGENIYPEEIEWHLSQNEYVLESLVFDKDGKIHARVFLDYDALDQEFNYHELDETEANKLVENLLEKIKKEVNPHMASYSRINKMIEQVEEFEKTPTKKIKRYLYTT